LPPCECCRCAVYSALAAQKGLGLRLALGFATVKAMESGRLQKRQQQAAKPVPRRRRLGLLLEFAFIKGKGGCPLEHDALAEFRRLAV